MQLSSLSSCSDASVTAPAAAHAPPRVSVDAVALLWQRVLRRGPIGADENFFALGGNDALVDLLATEIGLAFGRQLPSATIACAPTIAELTALLNRPVLPAFSPLILLRPGSATPPVFIAHGLGGTAGVFEVARRIQTEHAIYGIQAKGIDGIENPLERVEEMAGFYLSALKEIEPHGPYLFVGYSFGGLIALEMSQQLLGQGRRVALLAMLEAYPHPRHLSLSQRARLFAQRAEYHSREIRRLPLSDALRYVLRRARGRLGVAESPRDTANRKEDRSLSFARATARVKAKARIAMAGYRPGFYRGAIKCVVSEVKPYFIPRDPVAVWAHLVAGVEVDTIPGDHLDMVGRQSEGLASVLTGYIRQATAELQTRVEADPSSK